MAKVRLKGKSGQSIETAFAEFIRFCKAKNLAPVTIVNYQREFESFNHFYNGEILDICGDTVIQFIEELQKRNIAPTSVNTALRLLRAVLNYWADQNYCQRIKIKLLKVEEQIKGTYTDDEISRLIKKPDVKIASFRECRTWAVINFFIGTGCRLSTLTAVRIGDIGWENELIATLTPRTRRTKSVPLFCYVYLLSDGALECHKLS